MNRLFKQRSLPRNTLLGDERGLTTVEYVVILVLIAIFSITAWTKFRDKLTGQISNQADTIQNLK